MTSKSIYQHGSPNRTGVLLINLGTPDAPTAQAPTKGYRTRSVKRTDSMIVQRRHKR